MPTTSQEFFSFALKLEKKRYETWKDKYSDRILLDVGGVNAKIKDFQAEAKYNTQIVWDSKYGHCIGYILKKTVKNGEIREGKYYRIVLGGPECEDTVQVACNFDREDYYRDELGKRLWHETEGQKVIIWFTFTGPTGIIRPKYYEIIPTPDAIPYESSLVKRENVRKSTYTLYRKIYERDNYCCKKCKSKKDISIHHRKYEVFLTDELNMNNMLVLCQKCHDMMTEEQVSANVFKSGQKIMSDF